jgi:hypothetical protein
MIIVQHLQNIMLFFHLSITASTVKNISIFPVFFWWEEGGLGHSDVIGGIE